MSDIPWFNVDDGFANSKPVLRIPRRYRCAAIGLWTLAGSWSAKELTDGFIPDHAIEEFASKPEMAAWLVRAELWKRVEDGWKFENWAKYQKTKEQVYAYRAAEAERKRKARSKPKTAGTDSVSGVDSDRTTSGVPDGIQPESALPIPTPLPTPEPEPKDDVPLPPEPPVDDWVATDVVVEAPAAIDNPPKPAKRYASASSKSVVRQELGNDYSDAAVNRIAIQFENLTRQGKPDTRIREALREWQQRPNSNKPEYIPTVYDDLVKASHANPATNGHDDKVNGFLALAHPPADRKELT